MREVNQLNDTISFSKKKKSYLLYETVRIEQQLDTKPSPGLVYFAFTRLHISEKMNLVPKLCGKSNPEKSVLCRCSLYDSKILTQ